MTIDPLRLPLPKPLKTFTKQAVKLPLRWVLILPFVLQLMGAVGLVGYLSFRNGERSVNALASKLMDEVGNRVTDNLEAYLRTPHELNQMKLNAIALGTLSPTQSDGWERFFWHQIQNYPSINITSIARANGDYRAAEKLSTGMTRVNYSGDDTKHTFSSYDTNEKGDRIRNADQVPNADVRKHSGFIQASTAPGSIWTDPYVSFLEPTLILSEMQPLRNSKNELDAIIIASLRLDYIGQYLKNLKISETGQVLIIDRNGNLIATSTNERPFREKGTAKERLPVIDSQNETTRSIATALQTQFPTVGKIIAPQTFRTTDARNQPQFIRVLPFRDRQGLDWVVAIAVPESDFMAQIHENNRNTILLCLAALGLAIAVGAWTSQWVTRPIGSLNRAAKAIASGDWTQTPNLTRDDTRRQDEVGELATSFSSMASQLQTSFQRLEDANQTLEFRVADRTKELSETLINLQTTQQELVQSEKMAALGQLVAGVAHEINTPIGAIRAASGNTLQAIDASLSQLPELIQLLNTTEQTQFFQLVDRILQSSPLSTTKEKRQAKRALTPELEAHGIQEARQVADTLVDMGLYDRLDQVYGLLQHSRSNFILDVAYNIARLKGNSQTIQMAVDRVAKTVFALKSYARHDHSASRVLTQIPDGLDTILTLYQNQIKQGLQVRQDYATVPAIWCYPDELNQVWNNLVHNAIQAMGNQGTLTLRVRQQGDCLQIEVEDTGTGIPAEVLPRIFEPFFTTKPIGEGSGLGLDIVKKIIDKHNGKIFVASHPGQTCFTVELPIEQQQPRTNPRSTLP
jgi:signal transduction histidine kinase